MCTTHRTEELAAVGEALLQAVRTRTAAHERLSAIRRALAQAEREAADADANVLHAEQQQRVLLVRSECAP